MDRTKHILYFTITVFVVLLVIDYVRLKFGSIMDRDSNRAYATMNESVVATHLIEEQHWQEFLEEQSKRTNRIQQVCNKNGYPYGNRKNTPDLNHYRSATCFVKSLSVTYCVPPKTGISNWHRIFYASKHNLQANQLKTTGQLYEEMPKLKSSNFGFGDFEHRMVNVRHPFARLYSCWKDKFQVSEFEDYIRAP